MINEIEKKYMYIVFGIAIIIIFAVLVIIWKPLFSRNSERDQDLRNYEIYSVADYKEQSENKYLNLAKRYIDSMHIESLISLIDEKYLNNNGLDVNNVKKHLLENDLLISTNSSTILYKSTSKNNGLRYVYTYNYSDGLNSEHRIHFIEDSFGNYKISFEQDKYPILNDFSLIGEKNGIKYKVKEVASYENSILLNIIIENNSNDIYTYDLSAIDKINLELNSYEKYNLDTIIAGNDSSTLIVSPGSVKSVDLSFNVGQEVQSMITGITFKNVKNANGDIFDINVELNQEVENE